MTTVPRKIWLKHPEIGQAGGMCRFQNASAPERYRERHEGRLSAKEAHRGHGRHFFSVNTELSVLTMAGAALGQTPVSKSASTAAVAAAS